MESVLRVLTHEACPVYLDDIIDFGRTLQEELDNLRSVTEVRGAT